MNAMNTLDQLDNLLDITLEELADRPEFITPPDGAYRMAGVDIGESVTDGVGTVSFKYRILETLELTDPGTEEAPTKTVEPGTEITFRFNLSNAYGTGDLKKAARPYVEAFGPGKLSEILGNHFAGTEVIGILGHRKGKAKVQGDPAPIFSDLVKVELI